MSSFASTLRDRISIQACSRTTDAVGQPLQVWGEVFKAWANVRGTGGMEAIKAGAATSKVKASIRLRYRAGLNAGQRVVHGATVYNVLAVLPHSGSTKHVDLLCESIP